VVEVDAVIAERGFYAPDATAAYLIVVSPYGLRRRWINMHGSGAKLPPACNFAMQNHSGTPVFFNKKTLTLHMEPRGLTSLHLCSKKNRCLFTQFPQLAMYEPFIVLETTVVINKVGSHVLGVGAVRNIIVS